MHFCYLCFSSLARKETRRECNKESARGPQKSREEGMSSSNKLSSRWPTRMGKRWEVEVKRMRRRVVINAAGDVGGLALPRMAKTRAIHQPHGS
jgi:hypothetical protein